MGGGWLQKKPPQAAASCVVPAASSAAAAAPASAGRKRRAGRDHLRRNRPKPAFGVPGSASGGLFRRACMIVSGVGCGAEVAWAAPRARPGTASDLPSQTQGGRDLIRGAPAAAGKARHGCHAAVAALQAPKKERAVQEVWRQPPWARLLTPPLVPPALHTVPVSPASFPPPTRPSLNFQNQQFFKTSNFSE